MSVPLLELVLRRQDARDADRDLAMMNMVHLAAAPLTGSTEARDAFRSVGAALIRASSGTAPREQDSAFGRMLAHARGQSVKSSG